MKNLIRITFFACALVAGAFAQTQIPGSPVKRTPIATVQLSTAKTVDHVQVTRIDYTAGQATGRHVHPVPVVGYVLSGSFVVQEEGKAARTYKTGEAIYEPAGVTIEKFDNASATEPATLIASYMAGNGDSLIQMLPPR